MEDNKPHIHRGYILQNRIYYSWDIPDPKTSIHLIVSELFDLSNFEGAVEFELHQGKCFILNRFERIK